jgi:outer membrane protein
MMKPHRIAVVLMSITLAASPGAAQRAAGDSLTLQELVQRVTAQNPALAEAAHAIEASVARVEQSRSPKLPTVGVDAGYEFLSPVAEFEFGGNAIKVFPENNYDAHVGVRQTLYDFQKTNAQVTLAGKRVTLAQDSRQALERDLSFRTAELFYGILFLRRSVEVQADQIATLEAHLEIAKKKVTSGSATPLDAMTTQVRVAAAQSLQVTLESTMHKQEIALRKLAALPPEDGLALRGAFAPQPVALAPDSLLAAARARRVEAQAAKDAVDAAKAQEAAAHCNDAPSLHANLAYGFKNGYVPNIDVLRGNVAAGLDVQVPLFDGHRTRGMEAEALAVRHAAEARQQDVDLGIQADVQQALSDVEAAEERVRITQVNIQQADAAVESARLRYAAGSLSNLDLLDAVTDRAQARLTNLQARYEWVLGRLALRRAVGSPAVEP